MKRKLKDEKSKKIVILISNKESLVTSFKALCRANENGQGKLTLNDAIYRFAQRFVNEGILPNCLFDGSADAYLPKPYNERLDIRIPESLKKRMLDKIDETIGVGISELVREYIVQCIDKKRLL